MVKRFRMKAIFTRGAILGAAALISGCASTNAGSGGATSDIAVTRFHLGQAIARGEIAIEPVDPAQGGSLEFGRYAAAVERQLAALGWRVVRGNTRSEQVALIRVDQGSRAQFANRPAVSVGIGGGFGGYRSGVGVGGGVSVPIGGRAGGIVVTELSVRLQRRSDGTAIWEGRAQQEARAGTPLAYSVNAVERLAPALFAGFPGESGRTIRLR
jgi:hypothetical protein